VARITPQARVVGFTSDLLFPISQQQEVAEILRREGRPVRYEEFETIYGHDTFLIEIDRLGALLTEFFASVSS
jgi:homoserine O-acetyltransferase